MEMEMVRKIMLEQEVQFREQVQELHRVYRVQKLLLQELRPAKGTRLELASGGAGDDTDKVPAKPKRRTFDLELPAEEYMDVEMEEPSTINKSSNKACDFVSTLSATGMNSVKDLDSSVAVHQQIGRNSHSSNGESEIFQMIKRAKSSDVGFKQQILPSSSQGGILGGNWGYGFDNGAKNAAAAAAAAATAAGAAEKTRANGFHVANDKVSKQQHQEVFSMNSKAGEGQHVVFLEPGHNRFAAENGKGLGLASSPGIENFNPFFASAAAAAAAAAAANERGSSEDSGKFFGAALGGLRNHVSYSNQGILIPSTNMARRDPSSFMEASSGLGLWWKSNSNYYHHHHHQQQQQQQQHQYQQVAVLQAGTPAQPAAAVQVAWQGSSSTFPPTSSYQQHHHGAAVLGMVPPPVASAAPSSYGNQEEHGGGNGWPKGASSNAGSGASTGFHYSASTPPKPPFKKPPKLILDGMTMELKVAPPDRDGPPVVGLLRQHVEEIAGPAKDQYWKGDGTESHSLPEEIKLGDEQNREDKAKALDLEAQSVVSFGEKKSNWASETPLEVVKSLKEDTQDGAGGKEVEVQRTELRNETTTEADLGRCEDAPSCSCSQPGCPICDTGSVEDVQVKQQRPGKIEKSGFVEEKQQQSAKEEVRDSADPPPSTSSKKRRFKLVGSTKDLLATRESERRTTNGKKPEVIVEELDTRAGDLSRDGDGGEKKKRKNLVLPKSVKSSTSKSHSSRPELKQKESSVSRHKEKEKGCWYLADNHDDGANLAAEILVSLAPAKRERDRDRDPVPAEKNGGVLRVHHKSKRRLMGALPTGVSNHCPASVAAASPKSSPGITEAVKDEKKKKKNKKSRNTSSKTVVAKFHESLAEVEDHRPKASLKSVKVPLTTHCDDDEAAAERSSPKQKKKLVTRKQHQHQQQHVSSSRTSSKLSSPQGAARDLSTTIVKVAAATKSSRERDGSGHCSAAAAARISSYNSSNNNSSEQESLDRLSQQQQQQNSGENSSEEVMGKESDEFEEEWSRRSWGPAARRKRMRRSKRTGL